MIARTLRHVREVLPRALAPLLLAAWLAGCGSDDPDPTTPPEPPQPVPTTVVLSATSLTLLEGGAAQLTAEVRDQNGDVLPSASVAWSSSDPTVATVDGSGRVTGVAAGSAAVRAEAGSASAEASVTVTEAFAGTGTLAVGGGRACALATSGAAWCWGAAAAVVDGSPAPAGSPVRVPGGHTFTTLSTAPNGGHACALTEGGAMYCWGSNDRGESTGASSSATVLEPARVELPGAVRAIAAGQYFSCAVTVDGDAWCWGHNLYGQLGAGSSADVSPPLQVAGGHTFASIEAGDTHTCGLTAEGEAYCWGFARDGAVGAGFGPDAQRTPVRVATDERFRSLSLGTDFSCGVTRSDGVLCWGTNDSGEARGGAGSDRSEPGPVAGLEAGVEGVSAGASAACAARSDGTGLCWGWSRDGRLGIGEGPEQRQVPPTPVAGGERFAEISMGSGSACGRTLAGRVLCWGSNGSGQLGAGSSPVRLDPVRVPTDVRFDRLFAGRGSSCGLDGASVLHCWGDLAGGPSVTPVTSDVQDMTLGESHRCVVLGDGTPACWGRNGDGQLGDGTTEDRGAPTPVATDSAMATITADASYTCGATPGGTVFCWGDGQGGRFGNDGPVFRSTTPVRGPSSLLAEELVSGFAHVCAREASGVVSCWGRNHLGRRAPPGPQLPEPVATDARFTSLASGIFHVCGIDDTEQVWCWGSSPAATGQGTQFEPVPVLDGATSIAAGRDHSCAVTGTGTVRCWGQNQSGQLGTGGVVPARDPVPGGGGMAFVQVAAGWFHTCGLTASGEAYCWGAGGSGELGIPVVVGSPVPIPVAPALP